MTSSRARASQARGLKDRKVDTNELSAIVNDLVEIKATLATLTTSLATVDTVVDDIKATLDAHVAP